MVLLPFCSRQRNKAHTSLGEMLCHSLEFNSPFLGKLFTPHWDELGRRAGLRTHHDRSPQCLATSAQRGPKAEAAEGKYLVLWQHLLEDGCLQEETRGGWSGEMLQLGFLLQLKEIPCGCIEQ